LLVYFCCSLAPPYCSLFVPLPCCALFVFISAFLLCALVNHQHLHVAWFCCSLVFLCYALLMLVGVCCMLLLLVGASLCCVFLLLIAPP
jgi:hypothetical protein